MTKVTAHKRKAKNKVSMVKTYNKKGKKTAATKDGAGKELEKGAQKSSTNMKDRMAKLRAMRKKK